VFFAPAIGGVWVGTADSYEIEFVDWTGSTGRRIQWTGPDLEVTQKTIEAYHDGLEVFARGSGKKPAERETERLVERLYARIGELTVERDFFRGGLERFGGRRK